jgi:putative ATP-dependent endonuclease of the OLD family
MHIVRLKISGFRGVRSADITLGRHAVLVGPNNSGKTTIIEALALLFGRDRLVRRLTEHDFHGSAPDARPVHRHRDRLHAQRPAPSRVLV